MMQKIDFDNQRNRLIERELQCHGIRNEIVLRAMRDVPREEFVSANLREFA